MALKKATETESKQPTAEELEAQRAADAKALEDKQAAEALVAKEEADKAEAARLEQVAADQKADEAKAISDKEAARLARVQKEADQKAASDKERLEQAAEVAKAAGKTPLERKLVLVESLTFSDLKQPSTGTLISGKGQAHLLADGWLTNQINARLMKLITEE